MPTVRERSPALAGAAARRRIALATALLVLPTLVAPASAQTQDQPVVELWLDRAFVLEGGNVTIFSRGHATSDRIEVRCTLAAERCPAYTAPARGRLVFPNDFSADGTSAVSMAEPRWNATYEVRLLKAGLIQASPPIVKFESTIVDVWKFPDREVEPGDRIAIASSGYTLANPPPVQIKITKDNASRPSVPDVVFAFEPQVPQNGTVRASFRFSHAMAPLVRCPNDPFERCKDFRLSISGGGKPPESYDFGVRPARVETVVLSQPSSDTSTAEVARTTIAHVDFRLQFRSGFRWLTFLDYGLNKGPKYAVERLTGNENVGAVPIFNGTATWSESDFGWVMLWKVPKDEKTSDDNGVPYQYRFVVVEQRDPYDNDILRNETLPFRIVPYAIPLAFQEVPVVVERTEKARWLVNLSYGDGSPFTSADNRTPLKACFYLRTETRGIEPCLNRPTVAARYLGGALWAFERTWKEDEPKVLQDWTMSVAWTSANPAKDKYDNTIASLPLQHFNLTVASPRVLFVTQVGDEKREGPLPLERGDLVKVTARILYPDGTTPFNRTRNSEGRVLPLKIIERNGVGDVVAIRTLDLTNPDNRGTWVGEFRLGKTAEETPAGTWRFQLDLADKRDPPNANATSFDRAVVPATILVTTTRDAPSASRIGESVQYRFRLNYRDGVAVDGDDVGVTVRAEVRPLRSFGVLGPPVTTLAPTWDATRREWVAQWNVPRDIPLERYVVVPSGQDLYGNVVRSDVMSRPIQLFTETLERLVLTQPLARIPRGETAVVVFEGREGDVGPEGAGAPRILVQRYDSGLQEWVNERLDVRAADEPGVEHTGIWATDLQTQAGLYRFHMVGKDAEFAFINATSREFLLEAVRVTRAALTNATNLTKGELVSVAIERREGDVATDAYVVQDGKRAYTIHDRRTQTDRITAQWKVPFTFPTGAFSIVIESRDRNGNEAFGEVGPFFVSASEVHSETVTDPVRIVQRGASAVWNFRSFYPSGDRLDGRSGVPEVVVVNDSGIVGQARVRNDGPNYRAEWAVPRQAALEDHWFEVHGRDAFGNEFTTLRSDVFQVEPGTFGRTIKVLPPTPSYRDVLTGFQVFSDPDDHVLEYTVVKLRAESAQQALNNFQGQVVARGDVRLADEGTHWLAEWRPPKDQPLGWYRFRIEGTDRFGNRIEQFSGAFQVVPSQLPVFFTEQPRSIAPGEPYTVLFNVMYPDRTPINPQGARVTAQVTRDDQAVPPEMTVEREGTAWRATWATPEELPQGKYRVVVSGYDVLGNLILRTGTSVVDYAPTNLEKLLGVPGPGLLAALAAVALGLLLPRRRD